MANDPAGTQGIFGAATAGASTSEPLIDSRSVVGSTIP
jgi:hypothetical protein